MKVFLLQEIIPSYRVPVFARLAGLEGIDLTVFYSRQSRTKSRENLRGSDSLHGFEARRTGLVELGGHGYQFGMLWQVLRYRPHVLIAGYASRIDRFILLLLCKALGIRFLWYAGGVPHVGQQRIEAYRRRGTMRRWLGRFAPGRGMLLLADGMIVYSRHAKEYYMADGVSADRIWVAPNSPDTDALYEYEREWQKNPAAVEELADRFAPGGENILLLIGRLNRARKVDVLLEAVASLQLSGNQVSLVVVGDGNERESLEGMASRLRLENVFFEGAIYDEKELSRYILACDIFVTPGVASLAIKMAMLFGKPVVTVDYGLEVHDIENGINGFLFTDGDAAGLAARLAALLSSQNSMREIGARAAETVRERININVMIDGIRRAVFAGPAG